MRKIILIGKNSSRDDYWQVLRELGQEVLRFTDVKTALKFLNSSNNNATLIVIDREEIKNPHHRKFNYLTRSIPRIILYENNQKGILQHLRHSFTFPLYIPKPETLLQVSKNLINIKNIHEENELLRAENRGTKRELQFFEEISKILTSSLELDEMLKFIMKKAKEITRADAWSVLLLDEESNELIFKNIEGKKKKDLYQMRVKMGEGIAGWVARERVPVIVPDVSKDSRFSCRIDKVIHFRIRSLLCVPIISKDKCIGVIELVSKNKEKPFTKDDLDFMLKLVDHAALAIERATLYQKMAELVITDDLTKLFNTRYLHRTLDTEIYRCDRYKTSLSLIFMDVDHFKQINDTYGHLVGSKLLVEIAQLLLKHLRSADIVARYGGDEYVIVLPQTPPDAAARITERLRKNIEQNIFLRKDGYFIKVTASFGVASYPESAKTKEELLRLADEAMYRIKNTTRNGVYAII
ncbi:MAG: sensor domain-containing diguanylate cyclase [Thermodesulfovibrionales bacterium]|nr:sensor domain-containing diguanylate cyclase [Thermodesulfovibrionales bacterium]